MCLRRSMARFEFFPYKKRWKPSATGFLKSLPKSHIILFLLANSKTRTTSTMYFSALLSPMLLFASLIVPTLSKPKPFKYPDTDWAHAALPLPVQVVHQFPVGTWMENLAVRKTGEILATCLSSPQLFQVDHNAVKPIELVHTFANATGCTGITLLGRDVFYVIAGNVTLKTLKGVPGSWSVYRVDVRHHHPHFTDPTPARVSLVANFPDAILLNGITVLSRVHKTFLITDSVAGVVYRLEGKTGKVVKVIEDPLMKGSSSLNIGINGIKIKKNRAKKRTNELYFTNSARNILARVLINKDGSSQSPAHVIANVESPDDFAFNRYQNVVVAQNGIDRVARVTGDKVTELAGSRSNTTAGKLYGPTAVRFGKLEPFFDASKADWMRAYVTTNGGTAQYLSGNLTRGGTVSMIEVRGYW